MLLAPIDCSGEFACSNCSSHDRNNKTREVLILLHNLVAKFVHAMRKHPWCNDGGGEMRSSRMQRQIALPSPNKYTDRFAWSGGGNA